MIAVPPSTTTGRGHPQRTTIPTSARVRRVPFPSPLPEAFPKSSPAVSDGSGSELRDLLVGHFAWLDVNTGVSAKGTPTHLRSCGQAMPWAHGLHQRSATLSDWCHFHAGTVSGCHRVTQGTRAPSSAGAAAAGGVARLQH